MVAPAGHRITNLASFTTPACPSNTLPPRRMSSLIYTRFTCKERLKFEKRQLEVSSSFCANAERVMKNWAANGGYKIQVYLVYSLVPIDCSQLQLIIVVV